MNPDLEPFVQRTQAVLEQRKVASMLAVGREATLRVDADHLIDQLMLRLEGYVLAEKLVGDTKHISGSLKFPASPWQFFKQRHADSWWLRWLVQRRPVRLDRHPWERSVIFERYAHFPESTLRVPELGRPVIFEQFTEDWR